VTKVEAAMTDMFRRYVFAFFPMRSVEQKPSSAASRTAASPPQSRMASRRKVSETEMCESRRGMRTVMRDPMVSVMMTSSRKRKSSCPADSRDTQKSRAAAPAAICSSWYG
jgi:hypothetical protein